MDAVYERCCGIDVHKKTAVACVVTPGSDGQPAKVIRTFTTMTDDLLALGDWLRACGVTHVAMESTGVYWKPLWNVLEDRFELVLVNAQHVKQVPGRKTDVRDCEWLADLLRHGLLKASFVPSRPRRELRELTRYRTSLIQERSAEVARLQKTLEGANLKLGDVTSVVLGVSGRAILRALVAGTTDPATLAELARGRLRPKRAALERALTGRLGPHQRFLIAEQLCHIDALDEILERVNDEIADRLRDEEEAIALLDQIPGVGRRIAEVLVTEIGTAMTRFPTAGHLASWAGMCPGNHESAGKRTSGKTRKGSKWLRRALTEAAHGAARTKRPGRSALARDYRRLVARRGKKKAAVAVGHRILVIAYHVLHDRQEYREPAPLALDEHRRCPARNHALDQLRQRDFAVTLAPKEGAA